MPVFALAVVLSCVPICGTTSYVGVVARQPSPRCSWHAAATAAVRHVALTNFSHPPFDLACSAGVLGREATPPGVPLHRGRRDRTGGRVQLGREHGEGTNHAKPGEQRRQRCVVVGNWGSGDFEVVVH